MNVVGEWVSRPVLGLSTPRGASAPPQIRRVGCGGLRGVVDLREQGEIEGGGEVLAVLAELGEPEAVEVRLVADDHVADRRHVSHDRGDVGRERGSLVLRQRGRRGAAMEDGEVDPEIAFAGPCGGVSQDRQLLRARRGEAGLPVARDPEGVEAHVRELVEHRALVSRSVVDGAHDERVRCACLCVRVCNRLCDRLCDCVCSGRVRPGLVVAAAAGEHEREEERRQPEPHQRTRNDALSRSTGSPRLTG